MILHIDNNTFYASLEILDKPDLKENPDVMATFVPKVQNAIPKTLTEDFARSRSVNTKFLSEG